MDCCLFLKARVFFYRTSSVIDIVSKGIKAM